MHFKFHFLNEYKETFTAQISRMHAANIQRKFFFVPKHIVPIDPNADPSLEIV